MESKHPLPVSPPAPIPLDEAHRLAALCRLDLLDTAPHESFDRVTRLAAAALGVPIVLVSLVDQTRQWFKSRVGLDAAQTPREISFCGHAVYHRAPLVVGDARLDARFATNPLVTAAPHVRAYLGIPLYTSSRQPIGTLCAIDTRPRDFSREDVATLSDFADVLHELIHAKERDFETQASLQLAVDEAKTFHDTFDLATVGIAHTTLSGELIRVNRRVCELLGYVERELLATSFVDITHPDDVPANLSLFLRMAAGELDSYRMEKRFLHRNGRYVWCHLSVALRRSASGRPDHMISVIEDMSRQKRAEADLTRLKARLEQEMAEQGEQMRSRSEAMLVHVKKMLASEHSHRRTERRLRTIADSIPAMIGYWNDELRCEFANNAYRPWFGLGPEKIIGLTMRELMGDALFALNEPHARAALAGEAQHFARRLVKLDGTVAFTDAQYLPDRDEHGRVSGFYVLVTDVTALRAAQEELESTNLRLAAESATDYLTGLSNRRAFTRRCEEATAAHLRGGPPYGLILLDLDDFKRINDHLGHDGGDAVLRAVGRVLKEQMRDSRDVAARLGGEELAVLCSGVGSEDELRGIAERIRGQLRKETVDCAAGIVSVTASFGVSCSDAADADWKSIYKRADAAMYDAKSAGKDCVRVGAVTPFAESGRLKLIPSRRQGTAPGAPAHA